MKVLFVITNINGDHKVPYSFGLSSLAASVEKAGHMVRIEVVQRQSHYEKLVAIQEDFKPDVVGFTCVSSQFSCVKELAGILAAANGGCRYVCGGVHPTLYPKAVFEEGDFIDAVFVGESEGAFVEYLEKLSNEMSSLGLAIAEGLIAFQEWYPSPNIYWPNGYELLPLVKDLDSLPFPKKGKLFQQYTDHNGYAPFMFSRGCPYRCTYCSNHGLAKVYKEKVRKVRYRSPDSCIEEIKEAEKEHSFKRLFIMDDTFGIDRRWREEFCSKYKKKVGKPFIVQLRPNLVDEDLIAQLKWAGCYRVQTGVESGNEYIRNTVMNRKITTKQIIDTFDWCHKYGMETNALNIIGLPGETEAMIWDTIMLNRRIRPTDTGIGIFYPYRGTVLGDRCFSEGLVNEKLYNDFSYERRDTVLNFPEEYKIKLRCYFQNWELLVYPHDIRRRLYSKVRKFPVFYQFLRRVKLVATNLCLVGKT